MFRQKFLRALEHSDSEIKVSTTNYTLTYPDPRKPKKRTSRKYQKSNTAPIPRSQKHEKQQIQENRPKIFSLDCSLRSRKDGLSFAKKLEFVKVLDEIGIDFVEIGTLSAVSEDIGKFPENFRIQPLLRCPWSMTENIQLALDSKIPNINLIGVDLSSDTLDPLEKDKLADSYLKCLFYTLSTLRNARPSPTVFYSAENFFENWQCSHSFLLRVLAMVTNAEVDWLVLCDTNGSTIPEEVVEIIGELVGPGGPLTFRDSATRLAIHAGNGYDLAVANSLAAVRAGATLVQGAVVLPASSTANLRSCIHLLQGKLGFQCITSGQLQLLKEHKLTNDKVT